MGIPHITFTSPEVAQIDLTEGKARAIFKSHDLLIKSFDISKVDRAVNEDDRLGLIKIVAHSNGIILGASIVSERSGETITKIAIAMRNKLKLADLAATIHPVVRQKSIWCERMMSFEFGSV